MRSCKNTIENKPSMKSWLLALPLLLLATLPGPSAYGCGGPCYPTASGGGQPPDNQPDPCDNSCESNGGNQKVQIGNDNGMSCPANGQPVAALTGKEMHKVTDLVVDGVYPIRMVRKYDNQSRYDSPLGYGWAFVIDKRLFKYADGSVIVRNDCGVRKKYIYTGGAYQAPINVRSTLVENPDGTFTLTKPNGAQELYDLEGRLTAIVDPRGNRLEMTYDAGGRLPLTGSSPFALDPETPSVVAFDYRLTEIKERLANGAYSGHSVTLTYNTTTGRLEQIASHDGRTVTYQHDTTQSAKNGNLLQVIGIEGVTYTYEYNDLDTSSQLQDAHNVTSMRKGSNTTPYLNTYDAQDRVIQQDRGYDTYTFTYTTPGLQTDVTHTIRNADGSQVLTTLTRSYLFDVEGFEVGLTDTLADGTKYRTVKVRNGDARVTREELYTTPPGGLETLVRAIDYTYDTAGNRLSKSITLDSGEVITTTWTYDQNWVSSMDVVSSLDPDKHFRTEYTFYYDGNGNPTNVKDTKRLTDSGGFLTTTYTYDSQGRQLTTTLPDGHVLVNEYTGDFLSKSHHQVGGSESPYLNQQYGYDTQGNLTDITDASNNLTQMEYDNRRRYTKQINALGEETRYTYDPAQYDGKFLTQIERGYTSAAGEGQITRLGYTAQGWISTVERKDDQGTWLTVASYQYDSAGNRTTATQYRDGAALTTTYTYDGYNRLTGVSDPLNKTTSFAYDALGNRTKVTDAKGRVTLYSYDDLNRLVQIEQQGVTPSAITTFSYDAVGNLLTVTDPEGSTTTYQYDLLSRRTAVIQPLGQTVTTTYDDRGRVATTVNARGHKVQYNYLPWGPVDTIEYYDTTSAPTPSRTISYSYDYNGNITSVSDDSLQATPVYQYSYDALNRPDTTTALYIPGQSIALDNDYDRYGNRSQLGLTDTGSATYGYSYNKLNQLAGVTLPGSQTVGLDYYADAGLPKEITYPSGVTTAYQYKDNGPIDSLTTKNSAQAILEQRSYTYDDVLNILSQTSARESGTATYAYDGLDHLTQAIHPAATNLAQEDYSYDNVGNRENPADLSQYDYDANHRITRNSPLTYSFDADGNLQSKSDGSTFVHNKDNRLIQYTNGSTTATYQYDPFGRRISKTVNGVTTWFVWDGSQLLAEYDNGGANQRKYGYLHGEPLAASEIVATQGPTPDPQDIVMDDGAVGTGSTGSWTGRNSNKATNGTYLQADGDSGATYRWTPQGINSGVYDVYAWWPGVKQHNQAAVYTLSHNGATSISTQDQSANGNQWVLLGSYLFDGSGTEYVEVSDAGGKTAADAIRFVEQNPAPPPPVLEDKWSYIHNDHLGTPRLITDAAEQIVWSQVQTAFGEAIVDEDPDGDTVTFTFNLRFPGQYFDEETGLHYNYFRDYDPSIGRYVQSDPIGILRDYSVLAFALNHIGYPTTSSSSKSILSINHVYNYVDKNPVKWFDYYGLDRYDWCKDEDCDKPGRICKFLTDAACKRAPKYCCEIEKTQCMSDAGGDEEKTAKCVVEFLECTVDASK